MCSELSVSNLNTAFDKLKFDFKMIYSEDISNHPLINQHKNISKDMLCESFEHKLWQAFSDGNFDIIFDPVIKNPGTRFSQGVLWACSEKENNLFDMGFGLGNYIIKSRYIMGVIIMLRKWWFLRLDGRLWRRYVTIHQMHIFENIHVKWESLSSTVYRWPSRMPLGSGKYYNLLIWCYF